MNWVPNPILMIFKDIERSIICCMTAALKISDFSTPRLHYQQKYLAYSFKSHSLVDIERCSIKMSEIYKELICTQSYFRHGLVEQ